MGHEAAGEVAEDSGKWKKGDRVTFDSTIYCGACDYCQSGQINLCDNRQVIGVSCKEFHRDGAYAEYVSVPSRVLYRLPDELTYDQAAMVEPVAVAVHAVRRAKVEAGQRVAVIGAGMIGLFVIQVLKAKGVSHIAAIDIDPNKLQLAKEMGADFTGNSSDGMELDAAIEAVGVSDSVTMAVKSVRKGGTIALVGNLAPKIEFPLQMVVTRELSVYGCCASQGEYGEALELIASGQVKVDSMISARISLEQAPEYFERLHSREPGLMKVIVCP